MRPRSPVAQEATNHPEAAVAAPASATNLGPYLKIQLVNNEEEGTGYYWNVVIETKADNDGVKLWASEGYFIYTS